MVTADTRRVWLWWRVKGSKVCTGKISLLWWSHSSLLANSPAGLLHTHSSVLCGWDHSSWLASSNASLHLGVGKLSATPPALHCSEKLQHAPAAANMDALPVLKLILSRTDLAWGLSGQLSAVRACFDVYRLYLYGCWEAALLLRMLSRWDNGFPQKGEKEMLH